MKKMGLLQILVGILIDIVIASKQRCNQGFYCLWNVEVTKQEGEMIVGRKE